MLVKKNVECKTLDEFHKLVTRLNKKGVPINATIRTGIIEVTKKPFAYYIVNWDENEK